MNSMQLWFIQQLIATILIKLDEETIRDGFDRLLDIIEDAALRSDNQIDDAVVLPLAAQLRKALDVPDND